MAGLSLLNSMSLPQLPALGQGAALQSPLGSQAMSAAMAQPVGAPNAGDILSALRQQTALSPLPQPQRQQQQQSVTPNTATPPPAQAPGTGGAAAPAGGAPTGSGAQSQTQMPFQQAWQMFQQAQGAMNGLRSQAAANPFGFAQTIPGMVSQGAGVLGQAGGAIGNALGGIGSGLAGILGL